MQVPAFALLLALILTPSVMATHTGPSDVTRHPHAVQGIFDEQLLLYVEAQSATSGAFLSLGDAAAGAAAHHRLTADPASGATSLAATLQTGVPSQRFEIQTTSPLAKPYYLNLSRPIIGVIHFSQSAYNVAAATPGTDVTFLRAELFQGTTRVGGMEDAFPPVAYAMAWPRFTMVIWPEVHVLEAGKPLTLRIARSGGVSDFLIGTGGTIQSYFDIRYTTVDPLAGALYLHSRKIVPYDPAKGELDDAVQFAQTPAFEQAPEGVVWMPNAEAGPAAGPSPLLLAPVAGLALALRRRNVRIAMVVALLIGVAGCMGGTPTPADQTGTDEPRSTADVAYEPRPDLQTPGIGAVAGHVQDDLGFPVRGAHLSFLGTSLSGQTDDEGDFEFPEMAHGTYTLRLDATGYGTLERTVDVRAGELTRVNITLVPQQLAGKSSGHRPHVHDDWAGQTTMKLAEVTVSFAACATRDHTGSGNTNCNVPVPLERSQPVPPGTGRVEVIAQWTPGATGPKQLGLIAQTGVAHSWWISHGLPGQNPTSTSGQSLQNLFYVSRAPGDPFNVAIFPNEADPGHQKFTDWLMWLMPANQDLAMPHRVPVTTDVSVTVTVTAHKMVVPFEPAHRDFWQNRTQIVLFDHAKRGPAPDTSAASAFPNFNYAYRMDEPNGGFVPPGTAEVRGYLSWTGSAASLTTWKIMYRPADKRLAVFGQYPEATMEGSGTNVTFVIKPTPAEVDQMYQRISLWWFLIEDEDEPVNSSPRTTWYFTAIAVRDPAWTND